MPVVWPSDGRQRVHLDAHDGAVPADQVRAAQGRVAVVSPGRLLRAVLRGRAGGRRIAQRGPHPAQRHPHVRHPVPCRQRLRRTPAQGRAQGRHLRPNGGAQAREARPARRLPNPVAGHALRRPPAERRPQQLPRQRAASRVAVWAGRGGPDDGRLPGHGAGRREVAARGAGPAAPGRGPGAVWRRRPGADPRDRGRARGGRRLVPRARRPHRHALRGLGLRAGDGPVHVARPLQGGLAGRVWAAGPRGGHRRGRGGDSLPRQPAPAGRRPFDPHPLLRGIGLPGVGFHLAAEPGSHRAAAGGRRTGHDLDGRLEPDGHAHGGAAAARLADAAAGLGGRHPCKARGGAGVAGRRGHAGCVPPVVARAAGPGAHAGAVVRWRRQRTGSRRPAHWACAGPGAAVRRRAGGGGAFGPPGRAGGGLGAVARPGRAAGARAGGRAADGHQGGRHDPGGLQRRAGRAAGPGVRGQGLDRQDAAGGGRADGHPKPQGGVQLRLRVLHRGDQGAPGQSPARVHPQADRGERRALHHAGAEVDGREDLGRAGTFRAARARLVPPPARGGAGTARPLPGHGGRRGAARRVGGLRGGRAASRPLPSRGGGRGRPGRARWSPPRAGVRAGRGGASCPTTCSSTRRRAR